MKDENVRIEVGSQLQWKTYGHIGHRLLDACVVVVTRIYKDCSFRVKDAEGKDKGRFKDSRSQWSREYDWGRDDRPEVNAYGNYGWGNTSGRVYPLPENVTDISLKAEIDSQKATKAKEEAKAQAERNERHAEIIEAQDDRQEYRLRIDEYLCRTMMVNQSGCELTIIFHSKSKTLWDMDREGRGEYEGVEMSAQAFGKRWSEDDELGWVGSVSRDGDTLQEALEAVVVSLW